MKSTPYRLFRNLELRPSRCTTRMQFGQRLLNKVQRRCRRVRLEVSASTITLDCVTPLWNLPFELRLRKHRCLRKIDLHGGAGGLHISDADQARESRRPQPRDGASTCVERK